MIDRGQVKGKQRKDCMMTICDPSAPQQTQFDTHRNGWNQLTLKVSWEPNKANEVNYDAIKFIPHGIITLTRPFYAKLSRRENSIPTFECVKNWELENVKRSLNKFSTDSSIHNDQIVWTNFTPWIVCAT